MGGSKDRLRGLVKSLSVSVGPSPLVLEVGGSGGQVNQSVISGPGSPAAPHLGSQLQSPSAPRGVLATRSGGLPRGAPESAASLGRESSTKHARGSFTGITGKAGPCTPTPRQMQPLERGRIGPAPRRASSRAVTAQTKLLLGEVLGGACTPCRPLCVLHGCCGILGACLKTPGNNAPPWHIVFLHMRAMRRCLPAQQNICWKRGSRHEPRAWVQPLALLCCARPQRRAFVAPPPLWGSPAAPKCCCC